MDNIVISLNKYSVSSRISYRTGATRKLGLINRGATAQSTRGSSCSDNNKTERIEELILVRLSSVPTIYIYIYRTKVAHCLIKLRNKNSCYSLLLVYNFFGIIDIFKKSKKYTMLTFFSFF